MPAGVHVELDEGFAHIQFLDKEVAGTGLAALIKVAGPGFIEIDSRSGERKIYIVPEDFAIQAGLVDAPKKTRAKSSKGKAADTADPAPADEGATDTPTE